jgi:predicted transcriptional regulator
MTESEMLEMIRAMACAADDGFTTNDIAERVGCNKHSAYRALAKLVDAGKLRTVILRRTTRHGRSASIPGYALPTRSEDGKRAP